MPALPESIFDIGYLAFAIISGVLMLKNAKGRRLAKLFGAMTLVLGCGDAFHLIPRVLNYFTNLNMTAVLGIGKLVTSITMTVFYVLLEYARRERYGDARKGVLLATWILAAVRIVLCCLPQNAWVSENPPLLWGVLRNIPFVIMGVMCVILWAISAKEDKPLRFLWLYVLLSFAFYIPVVLFAQSVPIIGMLMLPKTVMYILMIVSFTKSLK
ncbi:MAG: hypothetical protein IJG23_03455 [Clostridia bacterium]|nr:hypothetical protein [Clostridia bacterium]